MKNKHNGKNLELSLAKQLHNTLTVLLICSLIMNLYVRNMLL